MYVFYTGMHYSIRKYINTQGWDIPWLQSTCVGVQLYMPSVHRNKVQFSCALGGCYNDIRYIPALTRENMTTHHP